MSFRSTLIAANDLPYTPLAYLRSTGTQWIDTGVIPDETFGIKMKWAQPITGQSITPFGVNTSSAGNDGFRVVFNPTYSNVSRLTYGSSTVDNAYIGVATSPTSLGELQINYKQSGKIIGTSRSYDIAASVAFTSAHSALLFGVWNPSSSTAVPQPTVIGETIITMGQSIGRHSAPVLWHANKPYIDGNTGLSVTPTADKPGMLDSVTGKLFTNCGTSEFLYA